MPTRDKLPRLAVPTYIPSNSAPLVVWGDEESGFVNDIFYALSDNLVFLTVNLPPGGFFRSTDKFRVVYDRHACLYVLRGQYASKDIETGDVHIAREGEMIFVPEKRWHNGYNFGNEDLHLLEVIAPPSNPAVLAHLPRPTSPMQLNSASLSDFPRSDGTSRHIRLVRRTNSVPCVIGDKRPALFEVLASTERVFLALLTLPMKGYSDLVSFPFDVCYHGRVGALHIQLPSCGEYFALRDADVLYLPAGTAHRLFNHTGLACTAIAGGAGPFHQISVTSPELGTPGS